MIGDILEVNGNRKPHNRAKLSESDVLDIRARRAQGETLTSIANDYSIDYRHLGRIARGENWEWVGGARTTGRVQFADEDVYLRWERGELIREIAASLGRVSPHRVGDAIRRAGGRERRRKAIFARYMEGGATQRQVAEEFGVCGSTVRKIAREAWGAS